MKLWEETLKNKNSYNLLRNREKVNAPCAAYEAVYNKKCPPGRPGRYIGNYETKMWNGIEVDANLEDKWLNDLNNIKGIEIRSSCEGHNKDWVAFIVFRFLKPRDEDISEIKNKLERDGITKLNANIGMQGKMRYVVATKTWYGQQNWKHWWETLSKRIKYAIK